MNDDRSATKAAPATPAIEPTEKAPRKALSMRASMLTGAASAAALLIGFGGWALFAELSGAVVAHGQIMVDDNRQIVQHPDGGRIEKVLVRDAQFVTEGELLIQLDGSALRTELQIIEGQFFEALARMARYRAESTDVEAIAFNPELLARARMDTVISDQVEGQNILFETRREARDRQIEQQLRRIDQLQAQVSGFDEQRRALEDQLDLLDRETADLRTLLEKGLALQPRVMALEREAIDVRGQIGALRAQTAAAGEQEAEIELEILGLGVARREEAANQLQDLGQAALELSERRKNLTERIGRLDIRAPSAGIVLGLQVSNQGAVLRAADPVLYLVPQDRELIVFANVSPLEVDEVSIGQRARLVLPGLPDNDVPDIWGHIRTVSADTLHDEATNASYYRAEILIDRTEGEGLTDIRLLPGMPVETYIETGKRSPLAYLLKPFTDYFRNAFRES